MSRFISGKTNLGDNSNIWNILYCKGLSNGAQEIFIDDILQKINSRCITTWFSGSIYTVGDFVVNDNKLYYCTVDNSDNDFNIQHWQLIGNDDNCLFGYNGNNIIPNGKVEDANASLFKYSGNDLIPIS